MATWPVEYIPDPDGLFYRIPVGWIAPDQKVAPGVFKENKGSISTDWEKYSTAPETRARPGRPERFAVVKMIAGEIRAIPELTVTHAPVQGIEGQPDNRAHTCIHGLELQNSGVPDFGRKERIRTDLYKKFNTWEIPPNAPVE